MIPGNLQSNVAVLSHHTLQVREAMVSHHRSSGLSNISHTICGPVRRFRAQPVTILTCTGTAGLGPVRRECILGLHQNGPTRYTYSR